MCQVYYTRQNNTWLISNSSLLLSRISNISEFDPLGVSLFLCKGSGGSDRTLRQGIRVIPGGQHWKWERGFTEPKRTTYFDRPQLSRRSKRKLTKADIEQLAGEMIQICHNLAQSFGSLECPITAGRDSRLMVALLIRGEIEAQYFTHGLKKSPDIQIGRFLYVTDGWTVYPCFINDCDHLILKTYMTRVEGENTRLRHYLARLKRKTLCYSKSEEMLCLSIKLLLHYLHFDSIPL